MKTTIDISQDICNSLHKLNHEDCGFVYTSGHVFDKLKQIRNISKNKNRFRMSKWEVFTFLIPNIFKIKKICVFHVHKGSPKLSKEDRKNMISNILYLVVSEKKLYFYIEIKKVLYGLSYHIVRGINERE